MSAAYQTNPLTIRFSMKRSSARLHGLVGHVFPRRRANPLSDLNEHMLRDVGLHPDEAALQRFDHQSAWAGLF